MSKLILNAFSFNMVGSFPVRVEAEEVGVETARTFAATADSAVGHADTAAVFSDVLGLPVENRRATVTLNQGDEVLVGQYSGPRLPEGAATLPEGATIKWLLVKVG